MTPMINRLKAATAAFLFVWLTTFGVARANDSRWVRNDDPIIIPGSKLGALTGVPLHRTAVLKCDAGGYVPIPFQIDEKRNDGSYVFTSGKTSEKDEDAGIDGNDELVFLAADASDVCDAPAPSGHKIVLEIEARDEKGAAKWAYIATSDLPAARSPEDYITARTEEKRKVWRIEGKTYRIEQVQDAIYYNYLSVKGNDGQWTPNLVDRLKVRLDASMFFGMLKRTIAAEEFYRQHAEAWIDGPVRVIVLAKGYLVPFSKRINLPLRGDAVLKFYPSFILFPVTVATPVGFNTILTDMKLRTLNEFRKEAYGYGLRYYDQYNAYHPDVVIDGKVSEAESKLSARSDSRWIALIGDRGATINRVVLPKSWRFASSRFSVIEDEKRREPPESEPGTVGLGYNVDGLVNIPRGTHTIEVQYYFPEHFQVGDERRILDIVDRPLEVRVTPLTRSW